MKRILISWKSKNGIIMGAQVDDDVDVNIIQEELNRRISRKIRINVI